MGETKMNTDNENVLNRIGGVTLKDTGRPTKFECTARDEMVDIDFDQFI
jgi:hypothetical protein